MQRPDNEKEHFYESLNEVVNSNRNDKLIVPGDLNARVGSDWELWPYVLGKHGTGKMNSNGLILLEFCSQNHFSIMGSMFQLPNRLKCTWQHPRSKHWHQLDHVLANSNAKSGITIVIASLTADCYTDHRLVVCRCTVEKKKERTKTTYQTFVFHDPRKD